MSLVVYGMSVPIDSFHVIVGAVLLCYTVVSILLIVSLNVSVVTRLKIINKLIQLEETNHDLTEVVIALNEKVYNMNSKWKRKHVSLKDKITTIRDSLKADIETFQTAMDFQDTMNCEEFVNVKEKITCMVDYVNKIADLHPKMNGHPELNELLQLLNRIDDSVSNEMNDLRLELASCHERIQLYAECNGKNKQDISKLNETVTALKSIETTTDQITARVTDIEHSNVYAYGKCVLHKTLGYGSISSPVVDGNIYVLFDYARTTLNVKCTTITVEPRKTRTVHPMDVFRIQNKVECIYITGVVMGRMEEANRCICDELLRCRHELICDKSGNNRSRNDSYCFNISALTNLDIEFSIELRKTEYKFVRVRTFCDVLNDYTG
jgi:hypothetical protein